MFGFPVIFIAYVWGKIKYVKNSLLRLALLTDGEKMTKTKAFCFILATFCKCIISCQLLYQIVFLFLLNFSCLVLIIEV